MCRRYPALYGFEELCQSLVRRHREMQTQADRCQSTDTEREREREREEAAVSPLTEGVEGVMPGLVPIAHAIMVCECDLLAELLDKPAFNKTEARQEDASQQSLGLGMVASNSSQAEVRGRGRTASREGRRRSRRPAGGCLKKPSGMQIEGGEGETPRDVRR